MQEKTKDSNNLYIVKTKNNNSFYVGGAKYTTDLYEAKFYNSDDEIPKELKNNPNHNIININSEEGLEILVDEIYKSEKYMSIKSHSLGEIICGLSKLKCLFKEIKKEPY